MAACLAATPALAQSTDTVTWLEGEYVGVGAIDMHKLAQRRIYTYLMNFFATDKGVRQALTEIRNSGIVLEDVLQRIVVGVPVDVEHSEHIVMWETSEDLTKYRKILEEHTQIFNVRSHLDVTYYATKRENECIVLLDKILVLGSELRVKEIIASHKNGYRKGPKDAGLKAELKRVDRKKDAWFVFSLSDSQRATLRRTDPLIDLPGIGAFQMSEIQRGNLVFDFSKGLDTKASLVMASTESATRSSNVLNAVLEDAAGSPDVRDLGLDGFIPGIRSSAQKTDMRLTVVYDQEKFDSLIALVTQLAKGVSAPQAKGAATPE